MRCPGCGRVNRDDAPSCFACGMVLGARAPPPQPAPPAPPPPPPPPEPDGADEDLPEMEPLPDDVFQDEMDGLLEQITPVDDEPEPGEPQVPPPTPPNEPGPAPETGPGNTVEDEEDDDFDVEFELDDDAQVEFEQDDDTQVEFEQDDDTQVEFEQDDDTQVEFEQDDDTQVEFEQDDDAQVEFEQDESPPMSEQEEEEFLNSLADNKATTRMKAMQLTQAAMYRIANLKAKKTEVDEVEVLMSQAVTTTDYAYAIRITNQAMDIISELEKECDSRFFHETAEKFHFARSQMIIAKKQGTDTEAAESLLEDASQAIARCDYGRADGLITRALKSLE